MKKYIYSIFAAAALFGFAACDDGDYADWAAPMTAEQEEILAAVEASAAPVANTINWADELGEIVQVVNASATQGYDVRYELSFENGTVLAVDEQGCVNTEELKKVIESIFGKAPVERDVNATLIAYVTVEGVTVKKEIPVTFKALLTAPHISEHYYIVGGTLDWAASAASKELMFSHSDQNVYDDPIFTITFQASEEGDTWFAIGDDEALDAITNNSDWSKLLGTTSGNGKSGEEGMLAPRSELSDDGSFCVEKGAKFIKVELNMLDGTYKVTPLNFEKFVYVPGNAQGWSPDKAGRLCSANYDGIYTGFVYVDGGFKFTSQPNWDGTNYGAGDEGKVSATGGDFDWGTGVFYVKLNLQDLSYTATKVEKMGLIGDFNGWGGDVELTWNATKSCFEGDASAVTASGWKFRVNSDWAINLGGKNLGSLTEDGANLSETGSLIELFPLRLNGVSDEIYGAMDGKTPNPPAPTNESSEFLWTPGAANGWSHAAASRIYSADKDGCYEGFIYVDGSFKFTDEAGWSGTNFGAGEEGKLSTDGGAGDLSLEKGVYYVKVDINELTYSATKVEKMGVIGVGGDWDNDIEMTWDSENLCYQLLETSVSGGWKFRVNGGWDINLGGTADNLVNNGDNLSLSGNSVLLYPCRVGENDNVYCVVE